MKNIIKIGRGRRDGFNLDKFLSQEKAQKAAEQKQSLKGDKGDSIKGRDGKDGVSIKGDKGDKGDKGAKGEKGDKGERGFTGLDGKNGKNGRGIEKAIVDGSGQLIITFTDGEEENAGTVRGRGGSGTVTGILAPSLEILLDVNITSKSNNQVLIYDTATEKWINTDISSIPKAYRIISADDTALSTDYYIEVDTAGVTVTLDGTTGKELHVDNSSNGICYVTPVGVLAETLTLTPDEGSYFVYNGTNWRVK